MGKNSLSDFEKEIGRMAYSQGYDTIICGHTHAPKNKMLLIEEKNLHYINCGDWIENFTASEYYSGEWHLCYYNETENENQPDEPDIPAERQIYQTLIKELAFSQVCMTESEISHNSHNKW